MIVAVIRFPKIALKPFRKFNIKFFIGIFIKFYVIELVYIASASMEPTLKIEEHFWVNKLVYLFRKPHRNEIIVFRHPIENMQEVKRIIAVEGDKVEIINKIVHVNDTKLDESYIKHTRGEEVLIDDNFGPWVVPTNSLFVLGDNRDKSKDSRNWRDPKTGEPIPFVLLSNVKGKLIF